MCVHASTEGHTGDTALSASEDETEPENPFHLKMKDEVMKMRGPNILDMYICTYVGVMM